jgi:hypothetical protein
VFAFIYLFAQSHVTLIRYPVLLASDSELVEVGVRPAHDSLQNPVEFAQGNVSSHLDLTPDGWVRATKRDSELVNLDWFWGSSGHRCFSRAIIKDRGLAILVVWALPGNRVLQKRWWFEFTHCEKTGGVSGLLAADFNAQVNEWNQMFDGKRTLFWNFVAW